MVELIGAECRRERWAKLLFAAVIRLSPVPAIDQFSTLTGISNPFFERKACR
jgi:hypothetical protein